MPRQTLGTIWRWLASTSRHTTSNAVGSLASKCRSETPARPAKDRKISFAVIRNSFDGRIDAVGFDHRLMQRIPVHQIFRHQQGAVDVENVGVSFGERDLFSS